MRKMTVSPSRLNTFLHCPQTFVLEYLQPERPPQVPTMPTVFGVFVHAVIEDYYNNYDEDMTIYDHLAMAFAKEFGIDTYHAVVDYSGEYEKAIEDTMAYGVSIGRDYRAPEMTGYFKRTHGDTLGRMFHRVMGLNDVNAYAFWKDAYLCCQNFESWTKENKILNNLVLSEFSLDNQELFRYDNISVVYNGVIDLLQDDGDITIVDFKTNRTPYDVSFTNFSIQLAMYSVVAEQYYGKIPNVGYMELRTGKFTKKEASTVSQAKYRRFLDKAVKEMVDFTLSYEEAKEKGMSEYDFLFNYATRFPVKSAQVQGCPCKFVDKCIFKASL